MFSQSVIVLSYMLLWGGSFKKMDTGRLDRLLRKAGYVLGIELKCITSIAEKRRLKWMMAILDNDPHCTTHSNSYSCSFHIYRICSTFKFNNKPYLQWLCPALCHFTLPPLHILVNISHHQYLSGLVITPHAVYSLLLCTWEWFDLFYVWYVCVCVCFFLIMLS